MNIQLMKLRKRAGYKSRDDFAKVLGVNKYTYKSWETGDAMISLEQAYNCAVILGCTIDEIAGYTPPKKTYTDPRQTALNGYYESMNEAGKNALIMVAESMGKDTARRIEKESQKYTRNQTSMGA